MSLILSEGQKGMSGFCVGGAQTGSKNPGSKMGSAVSTVSTKLPPEPMR